MSHVFFGALKQMPKILHHNKRKSLNSYLPRFVDRATFIVFYDSELNVSIMIQKLNWESVPAEEVNPSMSRKIISGEKLMIAKIKCRDGFEVPLHHHVHEQVTQVDSGKMRFWFGENKEQVVDLYPGDTVVIPSNLPHAALMIGEVEEIDTWAPPPPGLVR